MDDRKCRTSNAGKVPEFHHEPVDEQRYPYSSIGKLYNETGASCSGVVISRETILTAAHCLYNYRTRRFIAASSLHFLVGYRTGRYSAHAMTSTWNSIARPPWVDSLLCRRQKVPDKQRRKGSRVPRRCRKDSQYAPIWGGTAARLSKY